MSAAVVIGGEDRVGGVNVKAADEEHGVFKCIGKTQRWIFSPLDVSFDFV